MGIKVCKDRGRHPNGESKLTELFASFGVPMWYDGEVSREQVDAIPCQTELSKEEVFELMSSVMRKA